MRRRKEHPFKHFDPELIENEEEEFWGNDEEWDEIETGEENKKQIKVNVNIKPTDNTAGRQQNGS